MRPNANKAKYAILCIWIVLVLEVVMFVSSYMQYDFLKTAQSGAPITPEAADLNDIREGIVGALYLIVFITSAVFFLRWFKTAYHNIRQKTPDIRYSEGWTIGGWCIPIVNLIVPYQIMKEIYTQTRVFLITRECEIGRTLTLRYVGWWWAFWVIGLCLSQGIFRLGMKAETVPELITVACMSMVDSIVGIPRALLTIKVIKDYSRIEPVLQQIDNQPPAIPSLA